VTVVRQCGKLHGEGLRGSGTRPQIKAEIRSKGKKHVRAGLPLPQETTGAELFYGKDFLARFKKHVCFEAILLGGGPLLRIVCFFPGFCGEFRILSLIRTANTSQHFIRS